jgi:hypothetical protein
MKHPLDELDIQTRLSLLFAKIRNIIYYRTEVEIKDPTRIRCQYMHILRGTREEICSLLRYREEISTEINKILEDLLELIPRKVKTEECLDIILKLKDYFANDGREIY